MSKSTKSTKPQIELVKKPKLKRSRANTVSTITQKQRVTINLHSPPPVEIKKKRSTRKSVAVKPFENPFAGARPQTAIETSARNTTFGSNFFQNPFGNPLPYSLILPPPPVFQPNIQQQQAQLRPPVFRPRVFIPSGNMINDDYVEPQFGFTRPAITNVDDDGNMSPITVISNEFPSSNSTHTFITPPFAPLAPINEDDFSKTSSQQPIASIDDGDDGDDGTIPSRSLSLMSNKDQVRPPLKTLMELIEANRREQTQVQQFIDENPPDVEVISVDSSGDTIIPVKRTRRTKVQMAVFRQTQLMEQLRKAEAKLLKEQNRLTQVRGTVDVLTDRKMEQMRLAGERELQQRRANPQPKKIKVKRPFVV